MRLVRRSLPIRRRKAGGSRATSETSRCRLENCRAAGFCRRHLRTEGSEDSADGVGRIFAGRHRLRPSSAVVSECPVLSVKNQDAREAYETEALRGG